MCGAASALNILMVEQLPYHSVFKVGGQHYAEQFARMGHRVGYLEPAFSPWHLLNFLRKDVRSLTLELWRNWAAGPRRLGSHLVLYTPFVLLPVSRFFPFNLDQVAASSFRFALPPVGRILARMEILPLDVVVISQPLAASVLKVIPHDVFVVYRITDDHAKFPRIARSVGAMHQMLVDRADLICSTSLVIASEIQNQYPDKTVIHLPNGVDYQHFAGAQLREPEDIATIPRPRVVYVGALDAWFDADQVRAAALACPDVSFLLIGPPRTDLAQLRGLDNVFVLGPRPYESVPQYLKACDVGMIPFRDMPIVQSVSPVKMYEYMASGLQVVARAWAELDLIRPPAYLARSKEHFIEHIRAAINAPQYTVEQLRSYALANSWEQKARELINAIERARGQAVSAAAGGGSRWRL